MLPATKIVSSKRWSLHLGSRMIVTDHNGGEMMALSSRLIISKYHCAAARINDDDFAATHRSPLITQNLVSFITQQRSSVGRVP